MMGTAAAADDIGVTVSAVRKAIARGTLFAVIVPGGRRGREYAITEAEVGRYRRNHHRPGHRKVAIDVEG